MPTYFQRPENALKRANEFIDVGKKQPALDALYDVIKSKKHRTWQKIHEPIMKKYLELCVDLRKSHVAKEGLYQYKNICQQVNIKSLEDVVRQYLSLAEERTEQARSSSQQAVLDIDDLESEIYTPELLLLSAVSGEDIQARHDRLMLTPWVKFLWESYRQCLDLLRNNSRVERLYQDIAQQAFQFCLKYSRKTEFRKLCDNLRSHLQQVLNRHQTQSTAINLNNADSQQLFLETRLVQLDSAITMELWQEAYKAVEDVWQLMNLSKKPPKPQLMANYYTKLGMVFWKSGNQLFHASALHRLFHLSKEQRKNLSQDELQKMASQVVLATLSIPISTPATEFDKLLDMEGVSMEKARRLATLLGLQGLPTRASLIKDMVRSGVLQHVHPQLQGLYEWLEVEFHPLKLSSRVANVFNFILSAKELELSQYVPALQNVTLMRLVQQVSQVYQTIQMSRLVALAPFATSFQLERVVVEAARNGDLKVRLDHCTKSLRFGEEVGLFSSEEITESEGPTLQPLQSEQFNRQLVQMSVALNMAVSVIQPPHLMKEHEDLKTGCVAAYRKSARQEHLHILARQRTIEERKEKLENLNMQREEEEKRAQEEQLRAQKEAEEARLAQEAQERERQRRLQERREIQRKQVQERLDILRKSSLGARALKDIDLEDIDELDPDAIMQKQVEQLEKEKRELAEKLKAQEKKVDHFERAKRLEELPALTKAHQELLEERRLTWDQQEQERITNMTEERQLALQHKHRMACMMEDKDKFINMLKDSRKSVFKDKIATFNAHLATERKKRLAQRKEQRKDERRRKWLEEKEEEEQRRRDEELIREREQKEAEEQEKREKEEEAYRAKLAQLEAMAEKQRQREREIEEREAKRKQELQEEESGKSRDAGRDDWRAKDGMGGRDEGSWRRRTEEAPRSRDMEPQGEDRSPAKEPWRPSGRASWRDRERDGGIRDRPDGRFPADDGGPRRDDWERRGPPADRDRRPPYEDGERRPMPDDRDRRGPPDDRWSRDGDRRPPPREDRDDWRRGGPPERSWRQDGPGRDDRDDWRRDGPRRDDRGPPERRRPPPRDDRDRRPQDDDSNWRRGERAPPPDDRERWGGRDDRGPRPSADKWRDRDDRFGDDRGPPRGFDRDNRGPPSRGYDREDRGFPSRGYDRDDRGPPSRRFERDDPRGTPNRGFDRDDRREKGDEPEGGMKKEKDKWRSETDDDGWTTVRR
ncbi:PREDICTED: eukaryotic translation initiation factor 3 subunit A-like [Branchiostoma belcheri]|uniref:Eukaryotic translation initiation factor 3 subunit A n=1 Tax=Branchiostoma belcheri TaxID=7741 RepID=A0A6P4Z136_BRABE|nr:PREDICTED: eukaryotic translation initiation factor 3 subunit A-like [Branchiostoma belcheri]